MKVPFLDISRQNIGIKSEVEKVLSEIYNSNSFIGGKYVKKFEEKISSALGVKYAVSCASGTDALVIALRAFGIGDGDEVITTAFTFFATAEAIAQVGAKPVFVDINEEDYLINLNHIVDKITDKTKAILPVHIFGAPCEMDKIMEMAYNYDIKVIEDSAQAIGAKYKDRYTGTVGHAGCFSFYPTKNLGGCGDGGMVTTDDDNIAIILSALHEHGAGKNGAKARELLGGDRIDIQLNEKAEGGYDPYKYYNYLIAYNSRLDAFQAAILSIKLDHLQDYNYKRSKIASLYNDGLSDKIIKPLYSNSAEPCWHQYVIRTEYKYELCEYLSEHDIGVGTFYPVPLHLQKAFSYLEYKEGMLPITEKICNQTVCLPIYPGLTDDEVGYVIDCINDFCNKEH